jgi:hypothetical protein
MTERAREDVESLLDGLREILTIAGIPEQQINVATGPRFKVNHFVKAFDWLHQFSLSPQMAELKKAYALRPPEVWQMYIAMGTEGLREQDILQEAAREVQKRWRVKRPRMFGKDKPLPPEEEECATSDS